ISDAVSVHAGSHRSYAVLEDGSVWAWGRNEDGYLGDGGTTDRLTPVKIPGLANVVHLDAGVFNTLAVAADGSVWGWGANDQGQVGDGTQTERLTAVQVPGLSGIEDIAAETSHSV